VIALPAVVLALLAQVQPVPATPLPGTSVTPLPQMSGTPVPNATPTPATPPASATPTPAASGAPATPATPNPFTYRFVPHQPERIVPGVPQIFAVYLNSNKLVSKGPIDIKVMTDTGTTVKVTSKSNGREGVIPMVGPGDYEAYSTLPKIPFIAAGMTVKLEFIATSAEGRKVSVQIPVELK
jgi:hypothetical protein